MKLQTDKAIVAKLLSPIDAEKNEAFELLYRRELPVVETQIMANNGLRSDAKDIFQEALVVLYNKICQDEGFHMHTSLGGFLQAVSRNLWLKELRKAKRLINIEYLDEDELPVEDIIEENLVRDEQSKYIAKQIEKLGTPCKELLSLFYFHKKRIKEIAAIMNINSEQVVKNKKGKCLKAFKKRLKDDAALKEFLSK